MLWLKKQSDFKMGLIKGVNQDYLEIVNINVNNKYVEVLIYKNKNSKDVGLSDFEIKKREMIFFRDDAGFDDIFHKNVVDTNLTLWENIINAIYTHLKETQDKFKDWSVEKIGDGSAGK